MDNYITCSVDFLKKKMGDSVICFFFRKADDSVRRAFGTLSPIIIDRYSSPSSEKKDSKFNPELVTYFDIEKLQWRSFRVSRLLGYLPDYDI